MLGWIVVVLSLGTNAWAIGVPHYECGEHGRFEYCIDGIPGCVVGCHCHPGYYFDTESKICEPNAKLVHEYRQLYEPTQGQPLMTPQESGEAPTTTTTTTENIAKEADELGNWLYNQFFKTIENQVINETNQSPPSAKPSRRSGSTGPELQLSRRSSRRKSRRKKSRLRKKLLRITEDDSMFDSDDSDRSSGSDSSNSSSDDSDTSTGESEPNNPKPDHKKNDDAEHGHRSFVMINKKPKPPLPSFIFLPNFETPFYPPIGLPPPPVMPMYPMVPVPPVLPLPCPEIESPTTTTAKSSSSSAKPMHSSLTTEEPKTETAPPTTIDAKPSRSGVRERHGMMNVPGVRGHHRRNKLQQEEQWGDKVKLNAAEAPPLSNVDFKYLTQLIHKAGGKLDRKKLPLTRRNYQTNEFTDIRNVPLQRLQDDPEEAYYSNLGQKIASLIRKEDTKQNQPSDSETQAQSRIDSPFQQNSLFQAQNGYSPRSYWERFARSPLQPLKAYGDVFPPQNYDNLFDIESEVETVADTNKPLSLGDLENALVRMNKAHVQQQNTIEEDVSNKESDSHPVSNGSWNVKLSIPNFKSDDIKPTTQGTTTEKPAQIIPAKLRNIELSPRNQNNVAPILLSRNNTRTLGSYVNRFSNLRGILMQNIKNIADDTGNAMPTQRNPHLESEPELGRAGHVEPTDYQGTFAYPSQVAAHKVHRMPIMKPIPQYQRAPLRPRTMHRQHYPGFFSVDVADDGRRYVIQETMNSLQPPVLRAAQKLRPTSFFDQHEFGGFD